jgi:NDP-sugar pyrophosphorylase family protein
MGRNCDGGFSLVKAIILSAGYGTRLRPITDKIAKPMVKVLGIPVIEYTLNLLNRYGIKDVLINRHYFPEQFESLKIPLGMNVIFSIEEDILGTLGGVLSFKSYIENDKDEDDFLIINGDILFDISLDDMILKHKRKKSLVTMALAPLSLNPKATPIYVDDFSNIVSIGGTNLEGIYKKYMFAGIHLVNKAIFNICSKVKNKPSCIVQDLYIPYIKSGKYMNAFFIDTKDVWLEIGDIKKYLDANLYILDQLYKYKINFNIEEFLSEHFTSSHLIEGLWVSSGSSIDNESTIIPPVIIGKNTKIERGSTIGPNVILGDDIIVSDNVKLEEALVMDKVKLVPKQILKKSVAVSNDFVWSYPS